MLKRAVMWGLCCVMALLFVHSSDAQDQVTAADALYKEGRKLAKEGNWAEACPKFEHSLKLDNQLGTLLNLADCYENLGKVATAWARWNSALERAKHKSDDRIPYIKERQAKIEGRLPKITINVTNPVATLTIKRGAVEVAQPMWGVPIPVDPHPIEVSVLRGKTLLERHPIQPKEGEVSLVTIDLAEIDRKHPAPAAPPPTATATTTGPAPPPPPTEPYDPTQRNVGLIVGGVGAAAVLVAVGLEVGALVKKGQADEPDACVNRFCSPDGLDAAEAGATFAEVGQWVGIAGLATLAVGVTIFLTAPSEPATGQVRGSRLVAAPWITPDAAGVGVGGTF